jgi:hypothetical protein
MRRRESKSGATKSKPRRNEIQAQRNEIQIQRDGIQIPGVQTFQLVVKVGIGLTALEIVDNFARLACSISRSPFTIPRRPAPDQASYSMVSVFSKHIYL